MSAFGSSVINKSNKRLAPKAPAHRRRPASLTPAPREDRTTSPSHTRFGHVADVSSLQSTSPRSARPDNAIALTNARHTRAATNAAYQHGVQPTAEAVAEEAGGVTDHPRKKRRTANAVDQPAVSLTVAQEKPYPSDRGLDEDGYQAGAAEESSEQQNISERSRAPGVPEVIASGTNAIIRSSAQSRFRSDAQPVADPLEYTTPSPHVPSQPYDAASRPRKRHNAELGPNKPGRLRKRVQVPVDERRQTEGSEADLEVSRSTPERFLASRASKRARKSKSSMNSKGSGNSKQEEHHATYAARRARRSTTREEPSLGNQPNAEDQADSNNSLTPARGSRRRRRQVTSNAITDAAADQIDDTVTAREGGESTTDDADYYQNVEAAQDEQDAVPRKKRRKRRVPSDGAEEHQIDPGTMTMYDLCRDSGKGKTSRLESEFQEVDWAEVVRRRRDAEARARAGETTLGIEAGEAGRREDGSSGTVPLGPRLKLVNGQIVVDASSLVVDRHAAARPDDAQPAVEERDITRRINSQSWINDSRRDPEDRYRSSNKSDPWSAEDTEKFYSSLRMFGTDFMMISKMFPGRTRRHIKLKFVREERANPARIKEALVGGSVPMDLQAYCNATGQRAEDYKDPVDLEEELKAEEDRQRAAIQKQNEEKAEAQRKKQEAAAAKAASGRQRKVGEKGAVKSRRRKQDGAAPYIAPVAIGAGDDVAETIELSTGTRVIV